MALFSLAVYSGPFARLLTLAVLGTMPSRWLHTLPAECCLVIEWEDIQRDFDVDRSIGFVNHSSNLDNGDGETPGDARLTLDTCLDHFARPEVGFPGSNFVNFNEEKGSAVHSGPYATTWEPRSRCSSHRHRSSSGLERCEFMVLPRL